jgi:hydroxypyruvate isomerase
MRFSANLGFLWSELSLPDAIRAAHAAGFDAVECHWPYAEDPAEVAAALQETGLPMLGLNTARGDVAGGENGLAALIGREAEARAAIDQALDYAVAIGAGKVHVMCGFASGLAAHGVFVENLRYACGEAAARGIAILIEPLNKYDAPGYFLQTTAQAVAIITEVGASNLKLMFDCYHMQLMEGDLSHKLDALRDQIGHIQFASVPDRGAPDHGEVDYGYLFGVIGDLGYDAPLGAEYKPQGPTEPTLGWMKR